MVDYLGENFPDTDLQVNAGQAEAYVNQLVTEKPHRMRKATALRLTAALAGAFFLGACGGAAKPEATSVPQQPVAAAAEAAKPTAQASETEKKQAVTLGGSVEANPTNPSAETVRLTLSDGLVNGEKPLIPLQDTLELSFTLKSENPIDKVSISLPEMLGMSDMPFTTDMAIGDTSSAMDVQQAVNAFVAEAMTRDPNFSLPPHDAKLLGLLGITCVRTADGNLLVEMTAPNRDIFYDSNSGRQRINLAQQIASGTWGLGVAGEKGPAGVKGAHNISVGNMAGADIARPADVTFTHRTTLHPGATAEAVPVPAGTRPQETSPASTVTPEDGGNDDIEKSKWITTEWADNQEIPLKEWWDDMESKGYIVIDDMARQFAPDQVAKIYDMVNNSNLIPKPVKYYEKGHAYISPCVDELQKLVNQGEGHVQVSEEAFKLIPGKGCDIFAKN